MAGSLRDQFLKAGVVDQKQARKAGQEARRSKKKNKTATAGAAGSAPVSQSGLAAERQAKLERDRSLNLEQTEARRAREVAAQTRQLIEQHRVVRADGETPFSFQDAAAGSKVHTLHLNGPQRAALLSGQLAVVALGEQYELIPSDIAARIQARDPVAIKSWAGQDGNRQPEGPIEDDPYKDFVVPDDLTW